MRGDDNEGDTRSIGPVRRQRYSKGDRVRGEVVSYTRGEDTIPGKEGEAKVSDSSTLPVYQCNHVRY
jgi:hypothetical protein